MHTPRPTQSAGHGESQCTRHPVGKLCSGQHLLARPGDKSAHCSTAQGPCASAASSAASATSAASVSRSCMLRSRYDSTSDMRSLQVRYERHTSMQHTISFRFPTCRAGTLAIIHAMGCAHRPVVQAKIQCKLCKNGRYQGTMHTHNCSLRSLACSTEHSRLRCAHLCRCSCHVLFLSASAFAAEISLPTSLSSSASSLAV